MNNIRKRNGKIIATYNDKDYSFNSITDLLIAISTVKNLSK